MKKPALILTFISLLSVLLVTPLLAQEPITCESDYTIQAGDSLVTIAQTYYGDREAYKAIVEATNAKAATDSSYATIDNPSTIQPGWKLCLPTVEGVTPQVSGPQKATEGLSPDAVIGTVEAGEEDKTKPKSAGTDADLAPEAISFSDQGLANEVKGISMESLPYDNSQPPGATGWPEHEAFLFDGEERLRIYPVKAYEDLWNAAGDPTTSNNVTQLRTILAKRPEPPQSPLPVLPPAAGYNDLAVQSEFLDFADGSGIRFVGRFSQDASSVLNYQIKYIFQGLTHDNKYYVSLEYPVSTTALPDDVENMTEEQQKQATDDFPGYLEAVEDKLNALAPADFTPGLSQLDALVQSIRIPEPAMTESQGATITGMTWKLQEVQEMSGKTISIEDPDKYTLELQPDGKAAVRADCNFGQGSYKMNGNELSIEINTLTRAMCPPDSLSDQHINTLNEVNSYVLEGGDLFISYGIDTGIMKFAR